MRPMRYLSRTDLRALGACNWNLAIHDICETIRLFRTGEADMVAESVMPMGGDPRNNAYGLPARVGGYYNAAGLKWTVHRSGQHDGLPAINSTTFINDLADGQPLGMVESALLTRIRTAAVSAVVMDSMLAKPPVSVAVLGAGEQAKTHIDMLLARFPTVRTIHIWNRDRQRAVDMVARHAAQNCVAFTLHEHAMDAIDGAGEDGAAPEAVLTCTSSPEPFIGPAAMRPGRLVLQIGFDEVKPETIAASDCVTVDLWGAFAEKSAKSLFRMYRAGQFAPSSVAADLPAMIIDGWRPAPDAAMYFSSFGLNVFDIAIAARLLRDAEALDIGTRLPAG